MTNRKAQTLSKENKLKKERIKMNENNKIGLLLDSLYKSIEKSNKREWEINFSNLVKVKKI